MIRLALLALIPLSAGCSETQYQLLDITGRVQTCEGKPAVGGTIVFSPVDDPSATGRPQGQPGREARGVIGEDGSFRLMTYGKTPEKGVVSGRHTLTFEMPPTKRPVLTPGDKEALGPDGTKTREAEIAAMPVYDKIPCSNKVEPAEVTVQGPEDVFELKLLAK
jgi:hypothetical protein